MFASLHTSTLAVARVQSRGAFADLVALARLGVIARKQRRDLSQLDAAMLNDIGLTAAQAATEAARPMWDVPKNWRL